MALYQIARYFNLTTYAIFHIWDIAMNMASVQDDKFLAQFYVDYLTIVLIACYIVGDLPEKTHVYLTLFTFIACCIRLIHMATRIVVDIVRLQNLWSVSLNRQY